MTERRLAAFSGAGYNKGRPKAVQALWFATQNLLFAAWWCPATLRPRILRLFGAKVGKGVFIRHRVRVLWPWKLEIGDNCWIGEGAWLLNLEPIRMGSNVCLSQEAFLCTGGHSPRSETFEYRNAAIELDDSVWVGARATVMPGAVLGVGATVKAGGVARGQVGPHELVG